MLLVHILVSVSRICIPATPGQATRSCLANGAEPPFNSGAGSSCFPAQNLVQFFVSCAIDHSAHHRSALARNNQLEPSQSGCPVSGNTFTIPKQSYHQWNPGLLGIDQCNADAKSGRRNLIIYGTKLTSWQTTTPSRRTTLLTIHVVTMTTKTHLYFPHFSGVRLLTKENQVVEAFIQITSSPYLGLPQILSPNMSTYCGHSSPRQSSFATYYRISISGSLPYHT